MCVVVLVVLVAMVLVVVLAVVLVQVLVVLVVLAVAGLPLEALVSGQRVVISPPIPTLPAAEVVQEEEGGDGEAPVLAAEPSAGETLVKGETSTGSEV